MPQGPFSRSLARLRAAARRRALERAPSHTFEFTDDAVLVIDPEADRIVEGNRKACELLGYSRDELLGTPTSAIHPAEMPQMRRFARAAWEEGHAWTVTLTCRTKLGQFLPAEISASAVELDGRRCIVALVRDRSEHRRR